MQRVTEAERALLWELTPAWRKYVRQSERVIMVPLSDGWGSEPVPLSQIDPTHYLKRLSGQHCSPDERDRNRRLFAVWEECANILRQGLRRHRQAKKGQP